MSSRLTPLLLYFCLTVVPLAFGQSLKYNQWCGNRTDLCDTNFVCNRNRCKCPFGSNYDARRQICSHPIEDYLCSNDSDCTIIDRNRLCNTETRRCECAKGFDESRDKKHCQKRLDFLGQYCSTDDDCPIEYSHCKNSICKCWPEFKTRIDKYKVGSDQLIKETCVRRICSINFDCQTADNPNLVCNSTICECEYGYGMDAYRTCVKLSRRQNCNITCQIIGGLFASIFMLSLIYWCFYCCYSIVKNYKMHNRGRDRDNDDEEDVAHIQRFMRPQPNPPRLHRNSEQTYSINSDDRYYCFDGQTPPTYSQLSDEPPDYETVVHMKASRDR